MVSGLSQKKECVMTYSHCIRTETELYRKRHRHNGKQWFLVPVPVSYHCLHFYMVLAVRSIWSLYRSWCHFRAVWMYHYGHIQNNKIWCRAIKSSIINFWMEFIVRRIILTFSLFSSLFLWLFNFYFIMSLFFFICKFFVVFFRIKVRTHTT